MQGSPIARRRTIAFLAGAVLILPLAPHAQTPPPPEILEFTLTPDKLSVDMTAVVSWNIKEFRTAKIDGAGPAPIEIKTPSGSLVVRGKDLAGNASRSLLLTVQGTDRSYVYKNAPFELCGMPLIKSLRVSPRPSVYDPVRIKKGDPVTFTYFLNNASRAEVLLSGVKIADAGVPAQENIGVSKAFFPEASGLAVLAAFNCAGDTVKSETVKVEVYADPPRVNGFFCDVANRVIRRGQTVTFRWDLANAVEADLNGSTINPSLGSQAITGIVEPREIVLNARNPAGTAQEKIFIDVVPEIDVFTASTPGPIVPGDKVALRWQVSPKAKTLRLDEQLRGSPQPLPRSISVDNVTSGSVDVSPPATATYTLTIEGPAGESRRDVTVQVLEKPTIATFVSNPAADPSQHTYKLTWQTLNADLVELQPEVGAVEVQGERQVGPLAEATEFKIVARNRAGSVEKSLLVEVQPEIKTFAADKSAVAVQDSVTLSWQTSGARNLTLRWTGGEQKIATEDHKHGSFTSPPLVQTTVFVLDARSGGGAAQQTLTVRAERPPAIQRFEADAANNLVLKQSPFSLRWTVDNATQADINGEPVLLPMGEKRTGIGRTTTFTLKARSLAGEDSRALTVKVMPELKLFSATPGIIDAKGTAKLSWQTDPEAEGVKIVDAAGGTVIERSNVAQGSCDVSPQQTTTYTITVQPGDIRRDVKVEVRQAKADEKTTVPIPRPLSRGPSPLLRPLESFVASPDTVRQGQDVTLRWMWPQAARAVLFIDTRQIAAAVPRGEYRFRPECAIRAPQTFCVVTCRIKGVTKDGENLEKVVTVRVSR